MIQWTAQQSRCSWRIRSCSVHNNYDSLDCLSRRTLTTAIAYSGRRNTELIHVPSIVSNALNWLKHKCWNIIMHEGRKWRHTNARHTLCSYAEHMSSTSTWQCAEAYPKAPSGHRSQSKVSSCVDGLSYHARTVQRQNTSDEDGFGNKFWRPFTYNRYGV